MKIISNKGDLNFVELSGTITEIDEYVRYIPRPVIGCNFISYRKRKNIEDEVKSDNHRLIIFDDEEFNLNVKVGDRIKIKGEYQSRNYTRFSNEIDELLKMSVSNYFDIFNELPCTKQPEGKFRQLIDWSKLMQIGLLPQVPDDSMYNDEGIKNKTQDSPYIYRVDENGEVFKESEHVSYEIIVTSYHIIDEDLDPINGDINKITVSGTVTRHPHFDMLGSNNIPFSSFTLQTESKFFKDRAFYPNVISWGKLAEDVLSNVRVGTNVKVVGRLQSREYDKEITRRWTTPSGNRKKKKIELKLTTREISASKVFLVETSDSENENNS